MLRPRSNPGMSSKHALWKQTPLEIVAQVATLGLALVLFGWGVNQIVDVASSSILDRVSQRIEGRITAKSVSIGWSGSGPTLRLQHVRVARETSPKPALRVARVAVRFNLYALFHGQLKPQAVVLDRPRIKIRWAGGGHFKLVHWSRPEDPPLTWAKVDRIRDYLDALIIKNGRVQMAGLMLPKHHVTLKHLNAQLVRQNDQRWRAEFDVSGPPWLNAARGHISFTGSPPDLDKARFALRIQAAGPLTLNRVFAGRPTPDARSGGHLDIKIDGKWRDNHFVDTSAQALTQIGVAQPNDTTPPVRINTRFRIRQEPGSERLTFELQRVDGNIKQLDQLVLHGRIQLDGKRLFVRGKHIPGELLVRLAKRRAPELSGADIHIAIPGFSAHFGLNEPLELTALFTGLRYTGSKVAFGPISGRYQQTAGAHAVLFHKSGGTIRSARYLKGRLSIDDLGGAVAWQQDADKTVVHLKNLSLTSGKTRVEVDGSIVAPANKPARADLTAKLHAPRIAPIIEHIPQSPDLPNPRLRKWLGNQILAGSIPTASITLDGVLTEFPFAGADSDGLFRVQLEARDATLRPKPGWPKLKNASGHLTIENVHLKAKLTQGSIAGIRLASSSGSIADIREPMFAIDAATQSTTLGKLRSFILDSPLADDIGGIVRPLKVSGPARVRANLKVPLVPGLPKLKVEGRLKVAGGTLKQAALPAPITDIHGIIHFNRYTVRADNIRATLSGVELRADLAALDNGGERINVQGHVTLPEDKALLAHYIPRPWLDYIDGQTRFKLSFRIGPDGDRSPFRIRSDLSGLAVNLPAPLAKPPGATTSLSVRVAPNGDRVRAHYDNRVTLKVKLDNGTPTQVHALIGPDPPTPPTGPGIWIGGDSRHVDGIDWFQVMHHIITARPRNGAKGQSKSRGLTFRGANLHIDTLHAGGVTINDLTINARATKPHNRAWAIRLSGAGAEGHVNVKAPAEGRLHVDATLNRLVLTESDGESIYHGDASASRNTQSDSSWPVLWPEVSPRDLPALDIEVERLHLNDQRLGEFLIRAGATPNGWRLEKARLKSERLSVRASGWWRQHGGRTSAQFDFQLKGKHAPRTINSLGLSLPIRAERTTLRADLRISPNPRGLDLRALGGNARLVMKDGRLPDVNPGPARVLGLLNISALPTRLPFNFGDVVQSGLAFRSLKVPAKILNGNAFIDSGHMATPVAEVKFAGRAGVASRDINMVVTVIPQVGSSLTIASAIFGGPLAGAIVFGLQKLLQEPLNKLSSITFNIRGSWGALAVIGQKSSDEE